MPGENSGLERAPARCLWRKSPRGQHSQLQSRPVSFLFGTGLSWHGPEKLCFGLFHSRLDLTGVGKSHKH